jgi:membrane-bound inhibitor of C-type lysozyme
MKTSTILAWAVLVIIVIALGLYALDKASPATYSAIFPGSTSTSTTTSTTSTSSTGTTATPSGAVSFYCQQGQINATFSASAVQLDILPDARYFTLPQVESGSGIRYEATVQGKDELFQSEGSSASLSENGVATYSNCVAAHITDAGGGYHTYIDQAGTFSFVYPDAFSIVGTAPGYTQSWMVNTTTMGMLLAEVQLPSTAQPKTNFAGANLTVGTSADPAAISGCLTASNGAVADGTVTINGVTLDKFTENSAAAGSLYTTTSYRLVRDNQCYAIEDTIHSSQLANYPKGTVTAFNQVAVASQLAAIVESFKFIQ